MKDKTLFTRVDVVSSLLCIVVLGAVLGAIGQSGRERAKRTVCMNNLRQLTSAWTAWAQDHGDWIVNGSAGFSKTADGTQTGTDWPCWIDISYSAPELQIRDSLLYPYIGRTNVFRCPVMWSSGIYHWTYSIVDSMFGAASWGYPENGKPLIRTLWQINRPSERFVFVDEGSATLDSWTLSYDEPRWHDLPPGHHNVGGTFSFADGHAEYHKWKTEEVIELCGLSWLEASVYMDGTDWTCNEDLEWVQIHAWGRLGYDPQAMGCP